MKEITLGSQAKENDFLRVNIGDKSYDIPLGGRLTPRELANMDTPAKTLAFLEKHIPKKVVESLCVDDYNALINAWSEATTGAAGVPAGE